MGCISQLSFNLDLWLQVLLAGCVDLGLFGPRIRRSWRVPRRRHHPYLRAAATPP